MFKLNLAHTGRIRIVLRYSRIRHPKADIVVAWRRRPIRTGTSSSTAPTSRRAPRAGDSRVCSVYISGLPAGTYQVRVGLETKVRVLTHLTLSWPAA